MVELTVNLQNDTPYEMRLARDDNTYTGDGKVADQPQNISPRGTTSIKLSSKDKSSDVGIDVGNVWYFDLPNSQTWSVATGYGFTSGSTATKQVGVAESSDPKDGAQAAGKGGKITSSQVFTDHEGDTFQLAAEATVKPAAIRFTVVREGDK
ncbi:hypothetical protein FRB90_011764 [Tulasnella sp. 427]|nr:hypothetical protein FRB90_011764 [Tulasnella sp. 427]